MLGLLISARFRSTADASIGLNHWHGPPCPDCPGTEASLDRRLLRSFPISGLRTQTVLLSRFWSRCASARRPRASGPLVYSLQAIDILDLAHQPSSLGSPLFIRHSRHIAYGYAIPTQGFWHRLKEVRQFNELLGTTGGEGGTAQALGLHEPTGRRNFQSGTLLPGPVLSPGILLALWCFSCDVFLFSTVRRLNTESSRSLSCILLSTPAPYDPADSRSPNPASPLKCDMSLSTGTGSYTTATDDGGNGTDLNSFLVPSSGPPPF
ncbi:hypothetical protein CSPX01_05659 [Colletotrichum filicis]|nr:hypothetical protein CSPX01_05659 [Colletotrichum filicis]